MHQRLIFSIALLLASISMFGQTSNKLPPFDPAQAVHDGDRFYRDSAHLGEGYPYWVRSTIPGFESEFLLSEAFAGSDYSSQITNLVIENGWYCVTDSLCECTRGENIFPGDIALMGNRNHDLVGKARIGQDGSVWSALYAIATTDSLQLKPDTTGEGLAFSQSPEEELVDPYNSWPWLAGLFLALYFGILWFMGKRNQKKAKEEQARQIAVFEKSLAIIRKIEEGIPVYKAVPKNAVKSVRGINAGRKLLKGMVGEKILISHPVGIKFLKPVKINFEGTHIIIQPKPKDPTAYHLGQTAGGEFVLCTVGGNLVSRPDGSKLTILEDFEVIGPMNNPEYGAHQWAMQLTELSEMAAFADRIGGIFAALMGRK